MTKQKPSYDKLILFFAFGFGTGYIRPAPGTWGTLPGVLIAYFLMPYPTLHIISILVLIMVGTWLCSEASRILNTHDHGGIVIDEIVGVLITLLFMPVKWQVLLAGFLLFRMFDILKPFPIGFIDKKVNGGIGIMLDDIIAGVFAWAVLYLGLNFYNYFESINNL